MRTIKTFIRFVTLLLSLALTGCREESDFRGTIIVTLPPGYTEQPFSRVQIGTIGNTGTTLFQEFNPTDKNISVKFNAGNYQVGISSSYGWLTATFQVRPGSVVRIIYDEDYKHSILHNEAAIESLLQK